MPVVGVKGEPIVEANWSGDISDGMILLGDSMISVIGSLSEDMSIVVMGGLYTLYMIIAAAND